VGTSDDKSTAQQIKVRVEDDDNAVEHGGLQATITASAAVDAAQKLFANKTVVDTHMQREHGATVYSVKFSDNSRVNVRASDGVIVSYRDGSGVKGGHRMHHGTPVIDEDTSVNDDTGTDDNGTDNTVQVDL
jgi:hypothetical protein